MANRILACCVDKPLLKNIGIDSLVGNSDLALQVNDLLDGVKERLQFLIHLNFLHFGDEPLPEAKKDADLYKKGMAIYSVSTANNYDTIRKQLKNVSPLPSAYHLTKYRMPVEAILMQQSTIFDEAGKQSEK